MCIVMEYYEFGDLGRAVRKRRDKGEHVEELVR